MIAMRELATRLKIVVVGAWLLATALYPGVAMANFAPLPTQEATVPGGVTPLAVYDSIAILHEQLIFEFRRDTVNPLVTVEYAIRNDSGEALELRLGFIHMLPMFGGQLEVKWNDTPLTTQRSDWFELTANNSVDLALPDLIWMNPTTDTIYSTRTADVHQVSADIFQLALLPHEEGVLRVEYRQPPSGYDRKYRFFLSFLKPIYHYTYLLSPTKLWGSFGGLSIEVRYPEGMAIAVSPQLDEVSEGILAGTFPTLPEGELHLSVRPPGIDDVEFSVLVGVGYSAVLILWLYGRRYPLRHGVVAILFGLGAVLAASGFWGFTPLSLAGVFVIGASIIAGYLARKHNLSAQNSL